MLFCSDVLCLCRSDTLSEIAQISGNSERVTAYSHPILLTADYRLPLPYLPYRFLSALSAGSVKRELGA